CRTFAEEIISHWMPRQRIVGQVESSWSGRMLKVLERIGTPELLQRFLHDVLPKDFDGSEGKTLHRLFQRFGWEPFRSALRDLLAQQKPDDYFTQLGQIVSIYEPPCCDPPALTKERGTVCASLADPLAQVIERWDARRADARYQPDTQRAGVVEKAVR